MRVRVRFRFNFETGEVERFQVDDVGGGSGRAHDAEHDRVSSDIGSVLANQPEIDEVPVRTAQEWDVHGTGPLDTGFTAEDDEGPERAAQ
ncbi:hypothetical protein [Streptomyces sp. NPDC102476]|uniref:hypothetical protein n=1 Tax=Streptomyces sp. NPDC102476 TaxID=3366181 RepID=UPI0037FEF6E7